MKKKLKIIFLILGLISIVVIGIILVCNFIDNYKKDLKNTQEIIDKVIVETEQFEEKVEEYNLTLTQFIKLLNESSYYEKLIKNNKEMVTLLDKITLEVKDLDSFEQSKKYCLKHFADGKVTRACSSYSITYEKAINIYIDVVRAYNNLITKSNALIDTDKNIQLYESLFEDYIDYNNDNEYSGKNITSEGNLENENK